jgi:carotenoid cleavage dioxygenase-like enzyme
VHSFALSKKYVVMVQCPFTYDFASSGKDEKKGGKKVGSSSDGFMVNPMVNVWKFDDKFMTTTDQNLYIEFDPSTMSAMGDVNAAFDQKSDPITEKGVTALAAAHPRYDRYLRQHYNIEMDLKPEGMGKFHKPATYNLWRYNETGKDYGADETLPPREILATFDSDDASYVHSFALSKKYVVMVQCPFTYDFTTLMTHDTIEDATTWNPDGKTTVHVIDRNTGEIVQQITDQGKPWFIYHALNAYDDGDEVVVHLSRYDNSTLIDFGMKLENIVDEPKLYVPTYTQARLNELRVNVKMGTMTCEEIVEDTFEMATFNWVEKHMQQPQFAWAANMASPNTPWNDGVSDWIDQLVKVDLSSKTVVARWKQDGAYNCEPLFAPRPNATAEDDGVLLTIWADMNTNTSFLQVLDGQSMQEVARAEMPYIIQAHFHGKWCPEGQTYCVGL